MSEETDHPGQGQAGGVPAEDSFAGAPVRRPRRSPVIDAAVILLGGYLLFWMFGDVRYFFQGSEPRDLGDAAALVERGLENEDLAERYVRLRGTPDVQHAARMKLDDRTIGYLRLVEGGGSLFAAVPRDSASAPNEFEGTFEGRMRRLADSPSFLAIQQHFDSERIVEERDASAAALVEALGRGGGALTVTDSAGRGVAIGAKDSITLVVEQPDAQIQLGRSSFPTLAAAEAAVASLGVPYYRPEEQSSKLFYSFYARIAPDQRAGAQDRLTALATVPADAPPADPRVGVVVVPWTTGYLASAATLAVADGKLTFTPAENARPGFVEEGGKLVPRPLQDGRLSFDPGQVRAVRIERPVYVDPRGYIVEVGVRPRDRWLELTMWCLVLLVVSWNVASLVVWWRSRRV